MDRLQKELTQREFDEWQVYWSLEPFGQLRTDHVLGQLIALITNLFLDEGQPRVGILEVLPRYGKEGAEPYDREAAAAKDLAWLQGEINAGRIVDLSAEREKRQKAEG